MLCKKCNKLKVPAYGDLYCHKCNRQLFWSRVFKVEAMKRAEYKRDYSLKLDTTGTVYSKLR